MQVLLTEIDIFNDFFPSRNFLTLNESIIIPFRNELLNRLYHGYSLVTELLFRFLVR